jgi:hypothetical protein
MKSALLAVVIAAGVGEFVSSSNAQDIKKLQLTALRPSGLRGIAKIAKPTESKL